MDKKEKKQNNSMFLYTALIFAVALVLIIIAFFGQTNISNLRRSSENANAPAATAETAAPAQDELARVANSLSSAQAENESLKAQLGVYEALAGANAYAAAEDFEEAAAAIADIDSEALTEEQKILYDEITEKINAGKEQ